MTAGLAVVAIAAAGCGKSDDGGSGAEVVKPPSEATLKKSLSEWGWTPGLTVPEMSCDDDSYAEAVRDGVTYGTYSLAPYAYEDPSNGETRGIEATPLIAALRFIGVTKIDTLFSPLDSLIPGLNSNRIDVIPSHETPERRKIIAFSGPALWYGPGIAVPRGNPENIRGYDDLERSDIEVGVVRGSITQQYVDRIGGNAVPYEDNNTELQALAAGRQAAVLDDAVTIQQFIEAHPDADIELLSGAQTFPEELIDLGYGYVVYGLRKEDCSLNLALSRAFLNLRATGVIRNIIEQEKLTDSVFLNIPGTGD